MVINSKVTLKSSKITLEIEPTPWDCEAFKMNIAKINILKFEDGFNLDVRIEDLAKDLINENQINFFYTRVAGYNEKINKWLCMNDFKYIENIYYPIYDNLHKSHTMSQDAKKFVISQIKENEIADIEEIINNSLWINRYHLDPIFSTKLSNQRYINWVVNSSTRKNFETLIIRDNSDEIVAFFLNEFIEKHRLAWRLNAVAPKFQSRGLGKRIWKAMLDFNKESGYNTIESAISSRNIKALRIYTDIGFRFFKTEATYHKHIDLRK